MKGIFRKKKFFIILAGVISVIFICSDCFAAKEVSEGRKLWEYIMLWVNFGILVFLFIKFAKKPLMNFLNGEGRKIGQKIEQVEVQIQNARDLMEEEAEKLSAMDSRIEEIKNQIIEIGMREKEGIIEKARIIADQMIENAEIESQYKVEAAIKEFGGEMLEMAVSLAMDELRKNITQDDNDRIIEDFTLGLSAEKRYFA